MYLFGVFYGFCKLVMLPYKSSYLVGGLEKLHRRSCVILKQSCSGGTDHTASLGASPRLQQNEAISVSELKAFLMEDEASLR